MVRIAMLSIAAILCGCDQPATSSGQDSKASGAEARIDNVRQEIESTRNQLAAVDAEIRFSQRSTPSELTSEEHITLVAFHTELELDVASKEAIWEEVRDVALDDIPLTQEMMALVKSSPEVVRAAEALTTAQEQLNLAPRGPLFDLARVKEAEASLRAARDRYDVVLATISAQARLDLMARAHRNYLDAAQMQREVQKRLDQEEARRREQAAKPPTPERVELIQKLESLSRRLGWLEATAGHPIPE